ncbi:MAG TPA: gamma-glutamyltransferase, partial [Polyangiaceae bacterium]|nr:gamma-glutamyltransferase [Polyangiaceae bacterium]
QDLHDYRPVQRAPLSFDYRGFEIELMPPPSAGGVAIAETLLMMQARSAEQTPLSSPSALHQFIELSRRAQIDKRFGVMDPESAGYDDAARRNRWLHPQIAFSRMPSIDPEHATPSKQLSPLYSAALRELEHTTHFSVVDAEGTAVSCTTTLSAGYGAGFVVPGAGFVMNNSVAAFGTVGDSTPEPGRRTTSSMTPTLVLSQREPVAVIGTPGGDTIPSTITQVIVNLIDGQMLLEDAIDAPRVHPSFVPDEVRYESQFPVPTATRKALQKMGHRLRSRRVIGDANSVVLTHNQSKTIAWGYADPREGGLALGTDTPNTSKQPSP